MGEVYAAIDSRLGRSVAIKVLPEGFAADDERMARFELAFCIHLGELGVYFFAPGV